MQNISEKSVIKNIIFNFLRVICGILFPLISFPYAARILGVTNIGKVNYCTSIINYFVLFAGLGISVYATRQGAQYRDNKNALSKFVKEVFAINIASTALSYFILIILILFHVFDDYIDVIWICSLMIAFTTFGIEWLYQIMEDFKYISIRTIIIQFVSFICLFCFVKTRSDYPTYATITVIATGGNCFVNLWQSRKIINWRRKYRYDFKRHFKPLITIFGVSLSTSIYLSLDTVMIGIMRGDLEVGLYSAAVKLNSVVKTLITSVSTVMLSRLSYYIAKDKIDNYVELLKNGINSVLIMVIPTSLGIAYLHNEVIDIFCGDEYAAAEFACIILAINMAFSVIDGMLYNQVCLPNRLEKQASHATFIGAGVNLLTNLLFIRKWGYIGAAITTLISELVVFIILLKTSKEVIELKTTFDSSYQYITAGLSMVLVLRGLGKILPVNPLTRIVISVVVGGTVYLFVLIIVKNQFLIKCMYTIRHKNLIDK